MKDIKTTRQELQLYLDSINASITAHAKLTDNLIAFDGLPIEEWAGPGYAVAALFDPFVLTTALKKTTLYLAGPTADQPAGVRSTGTLRPQKERIRFALNAHRSRTLHHPQVLYETPFHQLQCDGPWQTLATIAELPGVVVNKGAVVFAFHPLRLIHRYLGMADPTTTRDITDLLIKAILASVGSTAELDDHDLRRDFHALGLMSFLLGQACFVKGRQWNIDEFKPELLAAARAYVGGDIEQTQAKLGGLFKRFATIRQELVPQPVYFLVMPHGGTMFPGEGYAEYDWPEAAADALNLYLDWAEQYGFHFAPDIGIATLEHFAVTHPATLARLRRAWDKGLIEFVNGTLSQPYLHLWHEWDQDKHFAEGLKLFTRLFGKRPTVFASQEMALHPHLPKLLKKHGFHHALHVAQNLGSAPLDTHPLIDWEAPDGTSIPALPAQAPRSERRGGEIWRHLPWLLTSERTKALPFIALTNLMDQTFIDIYNEEIARANRYAPVWGQFVTPTEFFSKVESIKRQTVSYKLDDYDYDLGISGGMHGHQAGGYSSAHAWLFQESRRLQQLERQGKLTTQSLRLLLDAEAHDSYIIPFFATGAFMEGLLADYNGPRYKVKRDAPLGGIRAIRHSAGYPDCVLDPAPATPQPSVIQCTSITCGNLTVAIDPKTGQVIKINDQEVSLGLLRFRNETFRVENISAFNDRLSVTGNLGDFGRVSLQYFIADECLFCEVHGSKELTFWSMDNKIWDDCVYLEHAKGGPVSLRRQVSGIEDATILPLFHSLDYLLLKGRNAELRLRHGGNIFFRQTDSAVHNRLWCYNEYARCFWWGVGLG